MIPKYLYHYTSIDSVMKIISSNSIRFTRLDMMNDPLEGMVSVGDYKGFISGVSDYVYCSCWSDDADESIALWGLYNQFKGVRIKVKSTIFSEFNSFKELEEGYIPVGNIKPITSGMKKTLDNSDASINKIYGPIRIQYVEPERLEGCSAKEGADGLFPDNKDIFTVKLMEIGNQKNKYWSYEREWRYKISPFANIIAKKDALIKDRYIADLPKEFFIPMKQQIEEIIMGPSTSKEDFLKLQSFFAEMGKAIPIVKSSIVIREKRG